MSKRLFLLFFFHLITLTEEERLINREGGEACHYAVDALWSVELSHSPFVAAPLVADVDGDGWPDVVAASFAEDIAAVSGQTGRYLDHASWPVGIPHASFYSTPLQYDVDKNGVLDIAVATFDGHIVFLQADGRPFSGRTLRVPRVLVKRHWYREFTSVEPSTVSSLVKTQNHQAGWLSRTGVDVGGWASPGVMGGSGWVAVDPHLLATPQIADLNGDGIAEELLATVSYYFDQEAYGDLSLEESLHLEEGESANYLIGGFVTFNLTSGRLIAQVPLELSKVDSPYPAYLLFGATLADLESRGGALEVVLGSSTGNLHVMNWEGHPRQGFPLTMAASIQGEVLVRDLNGDGDLELLLADASSNLVCLDRRGKELWDTRFSGPTQATPTIADIDLDGALDIIVTTTNGLVWAFQGVGGRLLRGWPVRTAGRILASAQAAYLKGPSHPHPRSLDVIVPTYEGRLYVISGGGPRCRDVVDLGVPSLLGVVVGDLTPSSPGPELLVASSDGHLLCLATNATSQPATPTQQMEVQVLNVDRPVHYVSGSSFDLAVSIHNDGSHRGQAPYKVQVKAGGIELFIGTFPSEGEYWVSAKVPSRPIRTSLTVLLTNQHGESFAHSFAVAFNSGFWEDAQWLACLPFLAMCATLLLLYGYPALDLLPTTDRAKRR